MNTPFLDLLQQITSGTTIYEPFPRNARGIQEFQDTVARLQEMEKLGLVRRIWTQVREIAGTEYYDMAMVQGGLTAEGERLLAEQQSTQKS